MIKNERSQEIINILKTEGYCTVKRLGQLLYKSESSIRRNLRMLEESGIVQRSYGGAELLASHTAVETFKARAYRNADAKKKIAEKAAALIGPGNIIFLDQSSTALFLARELIGRKNLTVVTNNLEVLNLLFSSDVTVYASGGTMTRTGCAGFIGPDAENTFRSVYADLCFFSTKALSSQGVITDCFREEIAVRNAMFGNCDRRVFLCDSSKFGSRAAFRQCTLSEVDEVVCEVDRPAFLEKINGSFKIL